MAKCTYPTFFVDVDMFHVSPLPVPGMEGIGIQNLGEMSVMNSIFSRWELAVSRPCLY
jgi:hypothetical protein